MEDFGQQNWQNLTNLNNQSAFIYVGMINYKYSK